MSSSAASPQTRQCWICFGEERAPFAPEDDWVSPCTCSGSTRWVHQQCLLAWLAATQPGMAAAGGPGDTTPALQAAGRAALCVPEDARCPQCHAPYRISEKTVLPRPVMVLLQRVAHAAERTVVFASFAGAALSVYVVAGTYGLAAVCACTAQPPMAVLSRLSLSALQVSTVGEALRAAGSALKVALGLPLVPLYAMSMQHARLQLLYPLVPLLTFGRTGLLDVRAWPASTTATLLPFAVVAYNSMRRLAFSRLLRRHLPSSPASPGAAHATPTLSVSGAESDAPAGDAQPNAAGSANASPNAATESSPATTEILAAEEEAERVIQRSIVDTAASLVLPFAAGALGALLFGRGAAWVPRVLARPLNRTVVAGLLILLARDAVTAVAVLQRQLSRATRRVLPYAS